MSSSSSIWSAQDFFTALRAFLPFGTLLPFAVADGGDVAFVGLGAGLAFPFAALVTEDALLMTDGARLAGPLAADARLEATDCVSSSLTEGRPMLDPPHGSLGTWPHPLLDAEGARFMEGAALPLPQPGPDATDCVSPFFTEGAPMLEPPHGSRGI